MQSLRDALRRASDPALALVTAFLLGALVIVLTDFDHLRHLGTDPIGALGGALAGVVDGYAAMISGAIGDPGRVATAIGSGDAGDIAAALRPCPRPWSAPPRSSSPAWVWRCPSRPACSTWAWTGSS